MICWGKFWRIKTKAKNIFIFSCARILWKWLQTHANFEKLCVWGVFMHDPDVTDLDLERLHIKSEYKVVPILSFVWAALWMKMEERPKVESRQSGPCACKIEHWIRVLRNSACTWLRKRICIYGKSKMKIESFHSNLPTFLLLRSGTPARYHRTIIQSSLFELWFRS